MGESVTLNSARGRTEPLSPYHADNRELSILHHRGVDIQFEKGQILDFERKRRGGFGCTPSPQEKRGLGILPSKCVTFCCKLESFKNTCYTFGLSKLSSSSVFHIFDYNPYIFKVIFQNITVPSFCVFYKSQITFISLISLQLKKSRI